MFTPKTCFDKNCIQIYIQAHLSIFIWGCHIFNGRRTKDWKMSRYWFCSFHILDKYDTTGTVPYREVLGCNLTLEWFLYLVEVVKNCAFVLFFKNILIQLLRTGTGPNETSTILRNGSTVRTQIHITNIYCFLLVCTYVRT